MRRPGELDDGYFRLHAVAFFSLSDWETGVSEMRETARETGVSELRAAVPIARTSQSITVDEERKGLRAVYGWLLCHYASSKTDRHLLPRWFTWFRKMPSSGNRVKEW